MKLLLAMLMAMAVGFLCGLTTGLFIESASPPEREVAVSVQTARVVDPEPAKPDTVIRWVAVKLPAKSDGTVTNVDSLPLMLTANVDSLPLMAAVDSAEVVLPITRRTYQDSTYKAVVEGYDPRLVELEIYRTRELVTVKKPPNRFHLGPAAGLGITPTGLQPFVGLTATYSLFSF